MSNKGRRRKGWVFAKSAGRAFCRLALVVLLLLELWAGAALAAKLRVVTTIFPLKDFAQQVGGERVTVSMLLPPGAEPHTWQPRPSDLVRISRAQVFLYLCPELEPWIVDILEAVRGKTLVVEAATGLKLIYIDKGGAEKGRSRGRFDPHVWLDFDNDRKIISKIVRAFSSLDPGAGGYYQKNARNYQLQLQELDLSYSRALRHCRHRAIVLGGHGAFAYLASRYGLEQISLYGLSPDSEPTPKRLARLIRLAKQLQIKAIYYEPFVSAKLARMLARQVGAAALVLNPGANLTRAQYRAGVTFFSLMAENLENLKRGLGCE